MRGSQEAQTRRARLLRQADNDAEKKLWVELRDRRLNGFKFVRQLPIGTYFADFACRDRMLVVEVDGSQHEGSRYDRKRDRGMVDEGWSILRLWTIDVLVRMSSVVETILAALEERLDPVTDCAELRFVASKTYREPRP